MPPIPLLQFHRKLHAFRTQLVVEGAQVAVVKETKVIGPPGVVAGEIGKRSDRTGRCGGFAGPVAANDQGLPPSSRKICGAPYATLSATISAPNICTYQLAEACGLWLMMWM